MNTNGQSGRLNFAKFWETIFCTNFLAFYANFGHIRQLNFSYYFPFGLSALPFFGHNSPLATKK